MSKATAAGAGQAARELLRERSGSFFARRGRRPRILLLRLADGKGGFAALAKAYADLGFDVDISSLVGSSAQAAGMAIDNDVHAVEAGCRDQVQLHLIGELAQRLAAGGPAHPAVVARGGFSSEECLYLRSCGVSLLCSEATAAEEVAEKLLDLLERG